MTDFGTPVQIGGIIRQGGNARVVIQPRGNWEHSAYQTDNRFIVEVKQVVEDPNRLVRPGFIGEKLSLNFQNVEVRAVLQVIADFTGLNIITSDTVTGNLTLRLKDVPWDQALDIILQSKGLDMRKTGNVVWIAPRDELATREKLALEAQRADRRARAAAHRELPAELSEGGDLQKILTDDKQRILSKRGSAVSTRAPIRSSSRTRRRAGGDPQADPADRHSGAPGDDRVAHRRSARHVQPQPRRAPRLTDDSPGRASGSGAA